tara:strand:+ start:73254 stop:73442 length:189 start_codon:yes stop_codon:yes gene_type:complete
LQPLQWQEAAISPIKYVSYALKYVKPAQKSAANMTLSIAKHALKPVASAPRLVVLWQHSPKV